MGRIITAKVFMSKQYQSVEELDIEPKEVQGGEYKIVIDVDAIGAILEVPDEDGIPILTHSRVNVYGKEYVIVFPYRELVSIKRGE
jgi:hypothetical protein